MTERNRWIWCGVGAIAFLAVTFGLMMKFYLEMPLWAAIIIQFVHLPYTFVFYDPRGVDTMFIVLMLAILYSIEVVFLAVINYGLWELWRTVKAWFS